MYKSPPRTTTRVYWDGRVQVHNLCVYVHSTRRARLASRARPSFSACNIDLACEVLRKVMLGLIS